MTTKHGKTSGGEYSKVSQQEMTEDEEMQTLTSGTRGDDTLNPNTNAATSNSSAAAAAANGMEISKEEKAAAAGPSQARIITGILIYSLCSSSLLLINKIAVESLPSVSFVLIAQFLFSVVVVKFFSTLGYCDVDPLEWGKVKQFYGVSLLFACCLFTNVKALQYANVETVIVFRSCSPIAVAICDYFLMGRAMPSLRSWIALLSILIGSILYVYFDKEFKVDSYLWTSLYFISIVAEMVYVKYIITEVKMTTWGRVYYNNLLSIPPVIVFGLFFNEHHAVMKHEWDPITIISILLSCVVGIGISWAGFNLRDLITATSFTVVGVVNKLATTAVNAMMWDKHADAYGIAALLICIAGGSLYQQSGKRQ